MVHDDTQLQELQSAIEKFRALFAPDEINSLQEFALHSVYTPAVTTWLMVLQRLQGNASLAEAVGYLIQHPEIAPECKRLRGQTLSGDTGGYSRARSRLDVSLAEAVHERVFTSFLESMQPSWEGRRVFVIDGTTFSLQSEEKLRATYPPATNQHGKSAWPILLAAMAHELASGCAELPEMGPMYGPEAIGEVALAIRLMPRLPPQSILMADRSFGVFFFAHAAKMAGHDVVTRLTQKRFLAMVKNAKQVVPGLWELEWRPTKADRAKHPELPPDAVVKVDLYEIHGTDAEGQPTCVWLSTTVPGEGSQFSELYWKRGDIETDIRDVKVTLRMNELRGRSAEMVRKEIALGMVAYNLVVQVRRLAARQAGVAPRRLSFKGTWSLVKVCFLEAPLQPLELAVEKFEWVLRACIQRALPRRKGRSYPREVLPRNRRYPTRRLNQKPTEPGEQTHHPPEPEKPK